MLFANDLSLVDPRSIPRGDFSLKVDIPLDSDQLRGLSNHLSKEDFTTLVETGELIYRHGEIFSPQLLFESSEILEKIANTHIGNNNNLALEVLMALEIPPNIASELNEEEFQLHVFNVLHRVSTMTGLEYYSASRGRMRTFYLSSSVVKRSDGVTPLPDPVFSSVLSSSRFYIRQEDASFGDNLYEVFSTPSTMSIVNRSAMYYGIILVAHPGDLNVQIHVDFQGKYLFFYAFSSMKAPEIFGLQDRVLNSFYNRLVSLYNWFSAELPQVN